MRACVLHGRGLCRTAWARLRGVAKPLQTTGGPEGGRMPGGRAPGKRRAELKSGL
jgi:hypothetical protein